MEVVADDVLVYGSGATEKEARISYDKRLVKLLQRPRLCPLLVNLSDALQKEMQSYSGLRQKGLPSITSRT